VRVTRIAVLASAALTAVLLGSIVSSGSDASAQSVTVTASATVGASVTATVPATVTVSATVPATVTVSATVPASVTASATTPAGGVSGGVSGSGQLQQPVTISIPPSVYSTPGTLTAYVNGVPCGTVTVTGTAAASFSLPSTCAAATTGGQATTPAAGQSITFRTASGTTLPQSLTLPSSGGALVLGATQTGGAAGTAPLPPSTGSAGLAGDNSPVGAAVLGLVAMVAVGATVVTRRYVRS
jgi:hypothetical protein